jgi:hypothetical protein
VRELREQAAQSATVCADCFQPLAPDATVTVTRRTVHIPAGTGPIFGPHPAWDRWLTVPICVTSWLVETERLGDRDAGRLLFGRDRHQAELFHLDGLERFRCEGCGRPMRRQRPTYWHRSLHPTERVCCADCRRAMLNARARERRRARHDEIICEACGEAFVPTRADARFCGNACRQRTFRRGRRP